MWARIKETYICDADETPSVTDGIFFFGMISIAIIVGGFVLYGLAQ